MRLATITTCKGRLAFLRQTLPAFVREGFERVHVEDWGCPDGAAIWAREQGEPVTAHEHAFSDFHKTKAANCAARACIAEGAEALVFLDADTVIEPGFGDAVRDGLALGGAVISGRDGPFDVQGLTGLLAVSSAAFERVGGFCEAFKGWGPEDLEMRLRLHLVGGVRFERLPLRLTRALPHEDALRERFTDPKHQSTHRLDALLRQRARCWGYGWDQLPPSARDLLYHSRTRRVYFSD